MIIVVPLTRTNSFANNTPTDLRFEQEEQPRRTFGVSFPVLTTRAHPLTEEVRPTARPMSTTLADVLYPNNGAAAQQPATGTEPQSPPSDLTPASPNGSSPGSDDDGTSRKRSASGSIKEGKERTANKICRVCGDKAYSYNFNVITCESCKAFFRRNANKEKEIRCPFNESCEINVVSRRFCQRCRLFKCFQVGMKKEWIMTDEARLEKKARVEENRERRREESKRKDAGDSNGYNHYRTTSQSSGGDQPQRAPKGSSAAAAAASAAAAAAAAAAEQQTANFVQAHQHHYAQQQAQAQAQHQQQQQQQQAMFQPELPTLATSNATSNLLDAMVAAAAVQQQQPFQAAAAMPTAAALVAAVAAPPPAPLQQPTNTELMAHAIAIEQHLQQTPFGVAATPAQQATAAAVYAVQQHQQAQHQQQMAAAVQQIVSMTAAAPPPPLVDATMAAALALPTTPQTTAAAILSAAGASPLGPLQQAALIMDATNAAATQQLLAAVPPPPSAVAAVATTMLLPPSMQPSAAPLPDRCRCTCNCGKYHASRSIVEQAQEEWEAERRGRRSHSSSDELGLSELLPSNSTSVSWLNPSTNQNPLTEGALSISVPTMNTDEAYADFNQLTESFVKNPLHPSHPTTFIDPEFGAMQTDDEERLKFLHDANKVWTQPLAGEESQLHQQGLPSKQVMLQMMVGAVKRMITMAKKFPALKALHPTDQLKLIKSCYLDVMIIRGAMAYDPKENAWKGPSASHDYKIKMDAMNDESTDNMFQQSIRLYTMFKEEYRSDDAVMLLLNMIVLFDPNVDGLTSVNSVRTEQNLYKLCLKRYMYTKLDNNQMKAQFEYKALLDRLATVRKMNSGARGIMEEHADSMDPLLKELLGKDDDHKGGRDRKNHSPKAISSVSSSTSIDEPMSNSSRA